MESTKIVMQNVLKHLQQQGVVDAGGVLDILASQDIHAAAKATCVSITVRNVEEKVEQWTKQNVTEQFFLTEFQAEQDRLVKAAEKDRGRVVDPADLLISHNPSGPTPSNIIIHMKEDIVNLLLGTGEGDTLLKVSL